MSITPDGWLDWAERVPGPPEKQYSQTNTAQGYIPHSAVGWYGGWLNRLLSTERRPDGRYTDYAAASVHGFIFYNGKVIQHYPFTVSCWASGNRQANCNFVAFENEGGYQPVDEALTIPQLDMNIRIICEISEWKGWTPQRGVNLLEHHEAVERWGGDSTACPSERIPWAEIMRQVTEEDDMAAMEEIEKLKGQIQFLSHIAVNHERRLKDQEAGLRLISEISVSQETRLKAHLEEA